MAPGGSGLVRGWRRMLKGGKAEGSPASARSGSTGATGADEATSSSGAYLSASATPPRHRTTDSASTLDPAPRSSHKPPAAPQRSAKMGAPSQASSPGRLDGSPPARPPALLDPRAQRAAHRHAAARREWQLSPPAAPTPAAREGSRALAGSAGTGRWGGGGPPAETDGSDTSLEFPEQVVEEGPPPLSSRLPRQLSPAASPAKPPAAALGPNPLFGGADGPALPPLSHELSSPGGSHSVSTASEAHRLRQDASAATRPAPAAQPLLLPGDAQEAELELATPAAAREPRQAPGGSDSWQSASSGYAAALPPRSAQHAASSSGGQPLPAGPCGAEPSWQPGSPQEAHEEGRAWEEALEFQRWQQQRAQWRAAAQARDRRQQRASEPPPHRPASAHASWGRQPAWRPAARSPPAAPYQPQSIQSQPAPPRECWQWEPRQPQWHPQREPWQPHAPPPWEEPEHAAPAWQEQPPWPERQWQPQPSGWEQPRPPRSAGWQEQGAAPPHAAPRRAAAPHRPQPAGTWQQLGAEEPLWQTPPPQPPLHADAPDARCHSSVGSNWRGAGRQAAREAAPALSGGGRLAHRFAGDGGTCSPSAVHSSQGSARWQPQPRASPLRQTAESEAAAAQEEAAELRRLLAYQQSKLAGAEAELAAAAEQRAAARRERATAQREAAALRSQLQAAAGDREELASVREQLARSRQAAADGAAPELARLRAALAAAAAEAEQQEERAETAAGELAEFRRRMGAEVEAARREALRGAALETRDAALLARQLAAALADRERGARECDSLAGSLAAAEQRQAAAEARAEELEAELEQQRARGARLEEQLRAALADAADRAAAQQRVAALGATVAELTEALEAAEAAAEAAAQQPSAAQVLQAAAGGKLPNGGAGGMRLESLLDSLELDSPVLRGNGVAHEPGEGLQGEVARLQQVEALAVDALRALEAQTREAAQCSARASELQASLAQCEAALQASVSRQAALEAALTGPAAAR